jgi:hypothetical protein
MNRRLTIAALIVSASIVAVLAAPRLAAACSCVQPPPPKEAMATSAAVFEGTVTAVREAQGHEIMTFEVELRVGRRFKGAEADTVTVLTNESSAACGFHFEVGGTYLVYAGENEGQLLVSLCSRTARIEDAAADLAALGGDAPPDPGSTPQPPPAVEPSKGGCAGCNAGPLGEGAAGGLLLVLAVALALRRRA